MGLCTLLLVMGGEGTMVKTARMGLITTTLAVISIRWFIVENVIITHWRA